LISLLFLISSFFVSLVFLCLSALVYLLEFVLIQYFAGGPLTKSKTAWTIKADPTKFVPPGRSAYTFGLFLFFFPTPISRLVSSAFAIGFCFSSLRQRKCLLVAFL
jgi:hypothetical protein